MYSENASVGDCPLCGTVVQASHVLIEYEKESEQAAYAECPSCTEVVRPR